MFAARTEWDPLETDVYGSGDLGHCDYFIVGEAPGVTEMQSGVPFTGQAGTRLDMALSYVGIPRTKCYIDNFCQTQIPKNNTSKLWTRKGFHHEAWTALLDRLLDTIERSSAKVVILCGETPLHALTGNVHVDKYRGSIYAHNDPAIVQWLGDKHTKLAGKVLLCTIHPARCIGYRDPKMQFVLQIDLTKAIHIVEHGFNEPVINMHISPTFDEAYAWLEEIYNRKLTTSVDIELRNTQTSCIAFTKGRADQVMCIPFYGPEGHYFTEDEEVIIWELISKILSDPQISKFAQNGMFDFTFLLRTMSILTNNFTFDSMLAHHLCYAELPKGLDALVSYYTTHPYYKDEGKDWRNVSDYTRFWQYNCKDAAYVHELYPTLMNELESYGQLTEFWFLMDLHTPLMEMQYRGIRTDRVGIQQLKEATDKAVVEMQKQLNEMAGKELNPNSSKQLQHYFYVEKKIKPYTNRKTGNWTTDDTALKRLSRRGYEEATLIQSIRKYKKLSSTYLVNRADSDGRLRCSYNIAGTETGRLSSSSTLFGTGTNLQNQPPAIKPYYHADDGYIMLEADEKQAEAVVVAYLAGDEKMIEGFESGVDVHTYNASNIFDVTMDQVMQDQRQLGKKVVHASNYDMGYKTFALQTELPEREAKLLLNAYHSRYPGLRRWHNSIREELTRSRRLLNLFGRHRLFLGMLNDHTFKAAYAFKPQSTVAEVLNRALVKITQADDLYERDFQLLGTVHDSLLNQFPATLDNALYIIPRLEELMTIQLTGKDGREFTIGIDFKIGYNWGRQSEQNPNGMVEIKAADPALIKKAWDDVHNKS